MAARKKVAEIEETAVEKDGDLSVEGKEGKEAKKTRKAKENTEGTASPEKMPFPEDALPLEEAFAKLDDIMEQLEQEKISLEDSFLLYQQGMKLLKQCNDSIDRVEKQLIILEEEGI